MRLKISPQFSYYPSKRKSSNVRLLLGNTGVQLIIGTLKVVAPSLANYMRNGQAIGIIAGCDVTAEYEILVNEAGQGFAAIKNRNMAYVLAVVFMPITSIIIFYWKLKPKSLSRPKPIEHG